MLRAAPWAEQNPRRAAPSPSDLPMAILHTHPSIHGTQISRLKDVITRPKSSFTLGQRSSLVLAAKV